MLESLVVFFPGSPTPVTLTPGAVSSTGDLAVLRIENKDAVRGIAVLPLAKGLATPGELVTVIGYPMGIAGMVAKSPDRNLSTSGVPAQRHYRSERTSGAIADSSFDHVRTSGRCGRRQADLRCADGARRQWRPGVQLQRGSDRSELRLHRWILRRHAGSLSGGLAAADRSGGEEAVKSLLSPGSKSSYVSCDFGVSFGKTISMRLRFT